MYIFYIFLYHIQQLYHNNPRVNWYTTLLAGWLYIIPLITRLLAK